MLPSLNLPKPVAKSIEYFFYTNYKNVASLVCSTRALRLCTRIFYKELKSVKVKGGTLQPITSYQGLKQGCFLSLLLFNPFMDDVTLLFDGTWKTRISWET